jgi:beta-ureidopropionase
LIAMTIRFGAFALLLAALLPAADLPAPDRFLLAAISVEPEPWNKEANFAKLELFARQAAAKGAKLVVTPEGFLEGYVGNENKHPELERERYFAIGEPLDGPYLTRTRELARELEIHLMLGFAELRDGRMYNSAVLLDPAGEVALHYSKSHTAHDEPFNTKGTAFPVARTALGGMGALICYDRRLPETARVLAIRGAKLILVPAWGSYNELNDALMRTRAFENGVWVAFVHPHRALLIDPRGTVVAQNEGEGDQLVIGEAADRFFF